MTLKHKRRHRIQYSIRGILALTMLVAAMLTAAFTRSTAVSAFVVAMLALVGLFCIPAAYNGSRAEQKRSILYAILCLSIMVISVLSAAI